jgi:TolA-binding protein
MAFKHVLFVVSLAGVLSIMEGCSRQATEEELLKSATLHHGNDEFDAALNDFRDLTIKYPNSGKMPEVWYAMGVIYQNEKKEFRTAESLYTKIVMNFPTDPTAQGAAYQRARILAWNLHQPDSAMAAYELFLKRYPDILAASSAREELDSLRISVVKVK